MLNHSTQSGRHSLKERAADLYETAPCAIEALLRVEKLPHWIWGPAAGRENCPAAWRTRSRFEQDAARCLKRAKHARQSFCGSRRNQDDCQAHAG